MSDERSAVFDHIDEMRKQEDALLALLPGSGSAVGNAFLRRKLGVSERDYWEIRDSLVARGLVGVGRGRGGSTFAVVDAERSRADEEEAALDSARPPGDEIPSGLDSPVAEAETASSVANLRPTIESIRVENFKRIDSVEVRLSPVTIFVGGNNAGKSSFLQAVHTAISCAQESRRQGQKVVSEANLRFAPAHDFALLGHRAPYENRSHGSRGRVVFSGFRPGDGAKSVDYSIEMYKGANHKNVGVNVAGKLEEFGSVISDPKNLFSVYVPGLSGILLNEESHGYPALFMRVARGDANLVFRNIIERLVLDKKGPTLEKYLSDIFGYQVQLALVSNPEHDIYVDVRLAKGENPSEADYLPVELWGMGMLQVTQLFAYALLFEPDLLLVDEPDSHVHASGQKLLMSALDRIASEMRCRVIVSTHSRHVVEARPKGATVVWMKDGASVDIADDDVIAPLMDMGALDALDLAADVVLATEDQNSDMLKSGIALLTTNARIDVVELKGVKNANMALSFAMISERVKHGPRIVVHRDRDFLTETELQNWSKPFEDVGVQVFTTRLCDIEAYFASADHLAQVTGMTVADATVLRDRVISDNLAEFRKKFEAKRADANSIFWRSGGSPANDEIWAESEAPAEEYIYGKRLLELLKGALKRDPKYRAYAQKLDTTPSVALGAELDTFFAQVDPI